MKKSLFKFSILFVVAVAAGCCPCRFARKNAKPLTGTTWHLVQLSGRDVQLETGTFDITFGADNRLTGIGACNRFSAEFKTTEKETLDIGTIAATRMLCPGSDTEQRMFQELDDATHYEIDGSMLIILNNGEIRAIFAAADTGEAVKK